ncbi:DUF4411 family protein [Rhizobium leguminosarum bv. viciae]|uniref:DUF4411 family protein n=1 Tax=Rhizobium leguminosarum TaxID=384 RepID=UPI00144256A8|nr:DUF4411 family protein [Rhizobium leguminosarum]NKL03116.1 DUF4411 family protein [Rhizobium leguminosarum bv. viciae]
MVKRYCFDTSGISNPLETMPEDIHKSLWAHFSAFVLDNYIAVTQEIFDEMCHVTGDIGGLINQCKSTMVLELGQPDWDWQGYILHSKRMLTDHRTCISEYTGGSAKTICLNDMTIIALAKTLGLPVVSMENPVKETGQTSKRKIPNICLAEGVEHLTFSDFLRREKLSF